MTTEMAETQELSRKLEALLFASATPLSEKQLAAHLPDNAPLGQALQDLQQFYQQRGIILVETAKGWAFRTAPDLGWLIHDSQEKHKKLSRQALETLAIIAWHQPVTRADIEDLRGISTSKGTLDLLLETGWVRMRGRRQTPGRPITYGTTPDFLDHLGLKTLGDLPGLDELKGTGLLEGLIPAGFAIPVPNDGDALREDEEPL
jgi:segregation and condensation protein B